MVQESLGVLGRIELLKARARLSWKAFGEKAGIPHRTIVTWYSRGTEPRVSDCLKIAEAFKVEPSWLAFGLPGTTTSGDARIDSVVDFLISHPGKLPAILNLLELGQEEDEKP